jgi:hypothetical protein
MTRISWRVSSGALAALMALTMSTLMVGAQTSTPAASTELTGSISMPAHIHAGTCAQLGDIVYPLSNVGIPATAGTPTTGGGTPIVGGTPMTSGTGQGGHPLPVYMSVTKINASIADILNGPHALNIHKSQQEIQTYVACGDVGGVQFGDTLAFGLHELNGSGLTGIALLSGDPNGGTNVVVYLSPTGPAGQGGMNQTATPSA